MFHANRVLVLRAFIRQYTLRTTALARNLGISQQDLGNKLNPQSRNKLSASEQAAILRYFQCLHADLGAAGIRLPEAARLTTEAPDSL